jgi:hypothetical protein
MLPTYPEICAIRADAVSETIHALVGEYVPIFKQIRRATQFEGRSHTMRRHDDDSSETDLSPISARITIPMDMPLSSFTQEALDTALRDVALQMAKGHVEKFVGVMDEATERTGNVVEGGGRPISEELVLATYEKMDHEFDARGNWKAPTLLSGADLSETMDRFMASPTFQARLKSILAKKLDEYRRREADRILAG